VSAPLHACSSEQNGGGGCGVHEDVVFREFLDVSLYLVHLSLQVLLAVLLAEGVQLSVD